MRAFSVMLFVCFGAVSTLDVAYAGSGDTPAAEKRDAKPQVGSQADMEKQFTEMLTGAVFVGSFQVTDEDGLSGKAALTPPQTEKYEIIGVSKVIDDQWIVRARIQYGDKDVTIPVPVRVVWAGDTPIITVKKMDLPMLGTYAARVMVYRNFYAGTWFGDCYGGVLSGQIVKKENLKSLAPPKVREGAAGQ